MPVLPVGASAPAAGAAAPSPGGFAAALRARAATVAPLARSPAVRGPALGALERIERAQARLDQVLAQARAGRTFTAAELLGLQAEAYRFGQTVDLGARLVEQGAQSVKQALNAQV
jgi:ribosomal protein L13E